MDKTSNINLSMLFDFYELTMGNGYFQNNMGNEISYFDVFYRSVPDKGGFAIEDEVSFSFSGDLVHMFSKEDEHNLEF